jgi:hypothetical protein
MDKILTFQNLVSIIMILIYGAVYFIQKSQFKKQADLLNNYEKIFSIINIDEIEKYVALQKKAIELSYKNRELEILDKEQNLDNKSNEVSEILVKAKSNLIESFDNAETVKQLIDKSTNHLTQISLFIEEVGKMNVQEIKELYKIIEVFKDENPEEYSKALIKINENINHFGALNKELVRQFSIKLNSKNL